MRLSTDFSHDSTACGRRRDASGGGRSRIVFSSDSTYYLSYPYDRLRHRENPTYKTNEKQLFHLDNPSFVRCIGGIDPANGPEHRLLEGGFRRARHPRYLGCRAARSDLHIDRQRSLHLRQRIRIRRRRGTAPRPHRFGGIYRSGRARHLDGDRFRRSRRSDQRRIQSLCVAQRPEPAARTHDLQSAFGHSGQSGHEYQRHRHLQRRTGGRSGRIGRFGGDKDGCRRDLLPRIGQKERICLHLGAERLRSGSFGYDATLLRLPKPVGFDGRATGFRTCEMRQQSSSHSRLHGRAPGPARFGPQPVSKRIPA